MVEKENKKKLSSSDELAEYLQRCDADIAHAMIKILRSLLCGRSVQLAKTYHSVGDIPAPGTTLRVEISHKIIELLGWY